MKTLLSPWHFTGLSWLRLSLNCFDSWPPAQLIWHNAWNCYITVLDIRAVMISEGPSICCGNYADLNQAKVETDKALIKMGYGLASERHMVML